MDVYVLKPGETAVTKPARGMKPIRANPAPGRNDPCPCGSGRKFKHCHLKKFDATRSKSIADASAKFRGTDRQRARLVYTTKAAQ